MIEHPTSRARGAVAGAVAAAIALAAAELPSAVYGESVSMVTAVGNEFVDRFAASLKDLAVELFGTNDKAALVVGIVVVSLAFGASIGVGARRRAWIGPLGFAVFGAVGALSGWTDPLMSTTTAVAGAALGVVAGVAVLRFLLGRAVAPGAAGAAPAGDGIGPRDDPTVRTPDRRAFLAWSGGMTVAAAAIGATGRYIRDRTSVDAKRARVVLPRPAASTPVPVDTGVEVAGVSPYLTPNDDFYRIDTALVSPRVDPDDWRLRVTGLVDRPYELDFSELLAMEMVEEPVTIACVSNEVGGRLVGTARWLGVPLASLLERAGVRPEATQIVGRSVDRFTVGFPTDVGLDGRTAMVAVGMNGEPLPIDHGFPARLIVSGLYGYVSATKWLTEIELTRFEDFDAYWIPRGWAKEAPVKLQSRIDVPRRRAAAGSVAVAGVAWSPNVGVAAVEVQVDDGPWESARLGSAASDDTWVQWVYEWHATPGEHRLRVRATDRNGDVQTGEAQDPRPDGATGHHERRIVVS